MTDSPDTICALSSAPGRAAVAVVRVCGPRAAAALEALAGVLPNDRRATLRTLRDPSTAQDIDRAIVLFYRAPSSFTGEDVVEILLHGGRAVIASVLAALTALGCRLAEPGEFARRAFENGKIDLTEAEGIADLIDAQTEAQRRQAVAQAGGVLHRLYEGWRQELLEAMALMEAGLDFADEEDVAGDAFERARRVVVALEGKIRAHLDDGRRGEILREGFRLVLAGPPNVGKSSLLNALAQREAAIVSPEAGTTRDVIEVRLDLGGYPVVISDTAGLREAAGAVEQEGIRRTLQQSRTADAILWVVDATSPNYEMPSEIAECGARIIEVLNKSDRVSASSGSQDERALRVSALTGDGLGRLVARVVELAAERIGAGDGPAITQARHREALTASRASLQDYLARDLAMPEIAAEDLRLASRALGRITGAVDPEEVLGRIFARFCIGK